MSIFNEFPYTNFHELNLDWLIKTVKDSESKIDDFILTIDDKIAADVDQWLIDHPEATTTVQDNSLTESKFTESLRLKTIKDYVTPQMFGAAGDGTTDDSEAFQEAMTHEVVYIPSGTYRIRRTIRTESTIIIGNNAEIYFDPENWLQKVFNIVTLGSFIMKGVNVNANAKAAQCFAIDNTEVNDTLDYVIFENCKGENTNNDASGANSSGVFIYRNNNHVIVNNCTFENMRKNSSNPGVTAAVGIHVSHINGTCDITNNVIKGVYYAAGEAYDADGIHAYSAEAVVQNPEYQAINISNNMLFNCAGRFIKIQGENVNIEGNTLKNLNIPIIDNFTAIDLQTGRGTINNNVVYLIGWSGSTQGKFITLGNSTPKIYNDAKIYNNVLYSDRPLRMGINIACPDSVNTNVVINGNTLNNFTDCLYISGNSTITAQALIVFVNNIIKDYTNSATATAAVSSHVTVYSNNFGDHEKLLQSNNVTVPNSVSAIKDAMNYVYNVAQTIGVTIGTMTWSGRGTFPVIIVRSTATRANVIVFYYTHMYSMYHASDGEIYYYDNDGTSI